MSSCEENVNQTQEGSTEDQPSEDCDTDFFGPSLPPHLLKKNSTNSEKVYGPTLPVNFRKEEEEVQITLPTTDEKDKTLIGPELPEHLKPATSSTTLDEEEEVTPGVSDDTFGPSPNLMSTGDVSDYYKYKIGQTQNKQSTTETVVERESWMTELPEKKSAMFGLLPRQFKSRVPTDKESDSSVWTETPGDKKKKHKHNEKDSKEILKMKRLKERDKEMEKLVKKAAKKLKKKEESLLEIHQKNMKKKEKKEAEKRRKEGVTVPERRPFDRNIDLQIRKVDENQRRAILNKSQFLNDRFASGESKFL